MNLLCSTLLEKRSGQSGSIIYTLLVSQTAVLFEYRTSPTSAYLISAQADISPMQWTHLAIQVHYFPFVLGSHHSKLLAKLLWSAHSWRTRESSSAAPGGLQHFDESVLKIRDCADNLLSRSFGKKSSHLFGINFGLTIIFSSQ